jgi:hypothetical protein
MVQHFPNLSLTNLSSSIMNIADLNIADLQALDELNRRCFQAMDPLLCDGARADEVGPKGNLGANLPDDRPACSSWGIGRCGRCPA